MGRAKEVQRAEKAWRAGEDPIAALPELQAVLDAVKQTFGDVNNSNLGIGSTIFAVKPGDGSAREQAASCQKVLGGWANVANEYATKRYRLQPDQLGHAAAADSRRGSALRQRRLHFPAPDPQGSGGKSGDHQSLRRIRRKADGFELKLGDLTDDEREIILKGCTQRSTVG